MIRICFVCLGNICRSPTAEGVFRKLAEDRKIAHKFEVDSAGTGDWHAGELADPRTRKAALARGIELTHRARQLVVADFNRFDHIVVMDTNNFAEVSRLAPSSEARAKVTLLRAHGSPTETISEVPDPYYGDAQGFEDVLNICETACNALLDKLTM